MKLKKWTGLFILLACAAFLWAGCSSDQLSTNVPTGDSTNLLKLLPDNAADMAQTMAVQNNHTGELMSLDGVVGTGTTVGKDGHLAVMVLTERPGVRGIPVSLDRIPVKVEVSGKFEALKLTDRYRPVPIGVSVGNNLECAAGTIGCVIYKGSAPYLLSNNHVFARENHASIGEDIVQPGRYDNRRCANNVETDKVGELADYEPLKFDGSDNYMDAAIAEMTTTDFICGTLAGFYGTPGASTAEAYVGMPIKKVGRTTELTTGTVSAVNVTINVGYSSGVAKFVGQIYTSRSFSKSGDSGSLTVTNDSNNNPVGLLFAGSRQGNSILTPMDDVLSRFGATICSQ